MFNHTAKESEYTHPANLSLHTLEQSCAEFFCAHSFPLDPSHDSAHTGRVVAVAKTIAMAESARLEVVIPAATFHDLIVYPKNSNQSLRSRAESIALARCFLLQLPQYPFELIPVVEACIQTCSFSEKCAPVSLEAQIVKDADLLEQTGLISILRTFASSGMMHRQFFHPTDPWCAAREPNPERHAFDLYYSRLSQIREKISTKTALCLLESREKSLRGFESTLKSELSIAVVSDGFVNLPAASKHNTCIGSDGYSQAIAEYAKIENTYISNLQKLFSTLNPQIHRGTPIFEDEALKINQVHSQMRARLEAYLAGHGPKPMGSTL